MAEINTKKFNDDTATPLDWLLLEWLTEDLLGPDHAPLSKPNCIKEDAACANKRHQKISKV